MHKFSDYFVNTQDHVASCLSQPHDWQLERRANCHLRAAASDRIVEEEFFNFDFDIHNIERSKAPTTTFLLLKGFQIQMERLNSCESNR